MAESGINPREIAQLFLERWKLILVAFAISLYVANDKSKNITRSFSAKATLQVDYYQGGVLSDIDQVGMQDLSDYDVLNTVVETINNTELMRQVIIDHDLLNNPKFASKNAGSASLDKLARSLSRTLGCSLRDETRLIDLRVSYGDETLCQDLVNWIADGYIKQHTNRRLSNNQLANTVLTDEANRLKLKLQRAEEALIEYRRSSELVVSLTEKEQTLRSRIEELNTQLATIRANITRIETDRALLVNLGDSPSIEEYRQVPSIRENPTVADWYAKYTDKAQTVKTLELRYRPKHPTLAAELKSLQEITALLQTALKDAPHVLEAEYNQLTAQETTLAKLARDAEMESLDLSDKAVEYNVLEREVTATTTLYDSVLARIKEIDLTAGLSEQTITVIERASKASETTPDKSTTVLMGGIFGLAIGMGIVYLLHMLDSTIKSVDHAEQSLELPVLGAIPGSEPKNRPARSRLIMLSAPSSGCAESFRSLRANVESMGSAETKTTLFTSSIPAEGKTFSCVNFALTLSQRGLKTIVIDLDLRHPSVGAEFSLDDQNLSVADIITDPSAFARFKEENLQNPSENLYVLPVGRQLANPAELVASETVANLVRRASEMFDRVVIDSAPLNPVGDTLSIVQLMDVIALVVRCGKTPARIIQRSLETLRRFNSPASGVVLNFIPQKKSMGNYYYYYGGSKSPYDGSNHYHSPDEAGASDPSSSRRSSSRRSSSRSQNVPTPEFEEPGIATSEPPRIAASLAPSSEAQKTSALAPPRLRRRRTRRPAPAGNEGPTQEFDTPSEP